MIYLEKITAICKSRKVRVIIMAKAYIIENEYLKLTVNAVGAEMISLVKKDCGTEYLKGLGGEFWARCAPLLFPTNGRLWENTTLVDKKEYHMENHGFAKLFDFKAIDEKSDSLTLEMIPTEEILAESYPYPCRVRATFSLKDTTVSVSVKVKNTGDRSMPYVVGFHPAFALPFGENESFEDYYLEFPCDTSPKTWVLSPRYYMTEEVADYPTQNKRIIPLTHKMFDDDAVFLENVPDSVVLKSKKSDKWVSFDYKGMQYLGIWHTPKTEAPFVCIEPWMGCPDYDSRITELSEKRDMVMLSAGVENEHVLKFTVN